jgi:hypothetical protein
VATRLLKASRLLWLVSFVAGLLAAYFVFLFRSDQMTRLSELLTSLDTNHDARTLRALATLLVWTGVGALTLVVALEAILVVIMMRRHGWARWGLVGALVVHAAVWVVVDAVIVAPDAQGIYLRILLVCQLALASAALVLIFFPGATAWFRTEHQPRRRDLS